MPKFGYTSNQRLGTCDNKLIRVAELSVSIFDMSIICGYRNEDDQMKVYNSGNSKAKWLESPHNYMPSLAFDAVPYYKSLPHIRWGDTRAILNHYSNKVVSQKKLKRLLKDYSKEIASFYIMCTVIRMQALHSGVKIISGCDWDDDWDITDQSFDDLGHIELRNWKKMV